MRKLREFKCESCDNIQERLVKDDVKVLPCMHCGKDTNRMLSAPMTNGNCAHGMLMRKKF